MSRRLFRGSEIDVKSSSVAEAIMALGESAFNAQFLALAEQVCAIDWCSAFVVRDGPDLKPLFSSGSSERRVAKALHASTLYSARYWRCDNDVEDILQLPRTISSVQMRRRRSAAIEDRSHGALHARHEVMDRVSLYRFVSDDSGIVLNLYRAMETGEFSDDELAEIENGSDVLSALVAKHGLLMNAAGAFSRHPPLDNMAQLLRRSEARLGHREAEVCALYLTGCSDKEAARVTGLELTSIATYRRRAYQKMGVKSRNELVRYYDVGAERRA